MVVLILGECLCQIVTHFVDIDTFEIRHWLFIVTFSVVSFPLGHPESFQGDVLEYKRLLST